ncbi:hypothetical protein CFN78_16335 [Amycolatopsis antarctica]|uniref:Cupin 2 conserved barrel domain-containing protein n=1 Tax=Amycolatopsis antarctica TaxID=1854586 RepID=A0A263D0Z6_9PSEU|nr:hypothetical protein [Amycolatopsis antarctica]OZM72110.1 hypothetical protein CFN78_16335 [Amycolatopsis antarctica]
MNAGFRRREIVLGPGEYRAYRAAEWRDAMIVVAEGELELETTDGASRGFGRGAMLCFAGLSLRVLRNTGHEPVTLIVISRDATDSFSAETPSHDQPDRETSETEQRSCLQPVTRRHR